MDFFLKITEKMLKEMDEDFQKWSFKEIFSENLDENHPSKGSLKMKFIIFKPFIIEQAKKGATRKFVWKYLNEKKKLNGTYDTFLRHLRTFNIDQFFSNEFHREKNISKNQKEIPIEVKSSSHLIVDSKIKEDEEKTSLNPLKDTPPPSFADIHKKHADDVEIPQKPEINSPSPDRKRPNFYLNRSNKGK